MATYTWARGKKILTTCGYTFDGCRACRDRLKTAFGFKLDVDTVPPRPRITLTRRTPDTTWQHSFTMADHDPQGIERIEAVTDTKLTVNSTTDTQPEPPAGRKRNMLKTALQAAALVAATGTAVTMAPSALKFWEKTDLQKVQEKLETVQAEMKLLEVQHELRDATAERKAAFDAATATVEAARAKYPDVVAMLEKNATSVLEVAELVKTLDTK